MEKDLIKTNRQWINNLSDKELAEKLIILTECDENRNGQCKHCILGSIDGDCFYDKNIMKWLKQKHKNL